MVYNFIKYWSIIRRRMIKRLSQMLQMPKKNNTVIFIHVVLKIRPLFDKIKDLTADELGNVNSEVEFEQYLCLLFYIGR